MAVPPTSRRRGLETEAGSVALRPLPPTAAWRELRTPREQPDGNQAKSFSGNIAKSNVSPVPRDISPRLAACSFRLRHAVAGRSMPQNRAPQGAQNKGGWMPELIEGTTRT